MNLKFHHIGVASTSIQHEINHYKSIGYEVESEPFIDEAQGVKCCFLVGDGPRLELVEGLPGSTTVTNLIQAGIRMYHIAYIAPSDEIDLHEYCQKTKAIVVKQQTFSKFFNRHIAFVTLRNKQIIELIGVKK